MGIYGLILANLAMLVAISLVWSTLQRMRAVRDEPGRSASRRSGTGALPGRGKTGSLVSLDAATPGV